MGYQGVKPSTPLAELREVCVAGPYNTRCAGGVGAADDGLQRSVCLFRLLAVLFVYHYYCLMRSLHVLLTTVQFYMETLLVFE